MSAHTPGPWRWEVNAKSKEVRLCGGVPRFDLTVLGFKRWGMSGATPTLRDERGIMHRAGQFAAPIPGREHHADWLANVLHPDAQLIEAAPVLLAALEVAEGWLHDPANGTAHFERLAEEFYRDTGFVRPGKDRAAAAQQDAMACEIAWNEWRVKKAAAVLATVRAAIALAKATQ